MKTVLIPRVPDIDLPARLRHHCRTVTAILNSLIRAGFIDLVGQDQWEASGGLEIGGDVEGGTPFLVLFVGADGTLAQDASFVYDPTNNVLRVPLFASSRDTMPNAAELPLGSYSFMVENADP